MFGDDDLFGNGDGFGDGDDVDIFEEEDRDNDYDIFGVNVKSPGQCGKRNSDSNDILKVTFSKLDENIIFNLFSSHLRTRPSLESGLMFVLSLGRSILGKM